MQKHAKALLHEKESHLQSQKLAKYNSRRLFRNTVSFRKSESLVYSRASVPWKVSSVWVSNRHRLSISLSLHLSTSLPRGIRLICLLPWGPSKTANSLRWRHIPQNPAHLDAITLSSLYNIGNFRNNGAGLFTWTPDGPDVAD